MYSLIYFQLKNIFLKYFTLLDLRFKVYTSNILEFTCMVKPARNRNKEKKRKVENIIKFT